MKKKKILKNFSAHFPLYISKYKVSKKSGFYMCAPNYKNFHFLIKTPNLAYSLLIKPTYIKRWIRKFTWIYLLCIRERSKNSTRLSREFFIEFKSSTRRTDHSRFFRVTRYFTYRFLYFFRITRLLSGILIPFLL